jgi:hypothetical protein
VTNAMNAALAAEALQKKHKGKVDTAAYITALNALRKTYGVTKADLKAARATMYAARKNTLVNAAKAAFVNLIMSKRTA